MSLIFKSGVLLTISGISSGAFGAHALKTRYPDLPATSVANWGTASQYLIYNGLGLMVVGGVRAARGASRFGGAGAGAGRVLAGSRYAAPLIGLGAVLFSGSLFGLILIRAAASGKPATANVTPAAATQAPGSGLTKILGPTTPLGGSLMIIG